MHYIIAFWYIRRNFNYEFVGEIIEAEKEKLVGEIGCNSLLKALSLKYEIEAFGTDILCVD